MKKRDDDNTLVFYVAVVFSILVSLLIETLMD